MDRRRAAGALLALAACIACSAAAPTASNQTALDLYEGAPEGCYYNFQHYGEGDRIMTNEPCLNCTCHNRMLMCYLRVCPFTKPIGQDCTVEKRADQCCPIVTCPDVPVDLLTSTSTSSPAEYGATGLGKLDKYGCSINGKYFSEGSKVPPTPNKPCEHCYCIRNMTTCVMQECTLHVDGCTPIYHKDVCCPVRYSCDHPEDEIPLLDDMSTTVRPTPGFLLTTTTLSPVTQMTQDCVHNEQIIADGASITTEKACEHCYCMKGDIVCVVQECGAPMENEGKNCTSLPPREGQCCPDTYICEGDEPSSEIPTEYATDSDLEKLTTLLPPRRGGVEGSDYRKEPNEVSFTEKTPMESELEGSGDEQEPTKPTDGKPSEPEESTPSEDGEQYISITTKAPLIEEIEITTKEIDRNLIPSDYLEKQTTESPTHLLTTLVPEKEDLDVVTTEVTKDEELKPYDHITKAPESYEKITTELGEGLNTVPDVISDLEHITIHEYPSVTAETEEGIGSLDNKQDVTPGSILEETSKVYHFTPGSETYDATTEKMDISSGIVTAKEELEVDHDTDSTTSAPVIEKEDEAATEKSEKIMGEQTSQSDLSVPSTTEVPKEEIAKLTTEPDHAQNTVAVTDEETEQHVLSYEKDEKPTSDLEDIVTEKELIIEPHEPIITTLGSLGEENELTTIEPDKGLNTIPSEIYEHPSSEQPLVDKTTSSIIETKSTEPSFVADTTLSEEVKTPTVLDSSTSLLESHVTKDQYTITTEPSFRKEDEASVSAQVPKEETGSTTIKPEFADEGFIPTSIHDEKISTSSDVPSLEEDVTTMVPEYNKEIEDTEAVKQPTTEAIVGTSVISASLPENADETTPEQESSLPSSTDKSDVSSYDEPSRIPGEGDCLLSGVTFKNNTIVPSTNNCHTGCRCVSSIIKCDPIICSPPPDYMDNCQSIYDTPDSCCPTYVCDHPRETIPPQSDNQMSGTESPMVQPTIECRGDQCELSVPTKQPEESSEAEHKPEVAECGPEGCVNEQDSSQPSIEHSECTDGKCALPPTHGQDILIKPCSGNNCKTIGEGTPSMQQCENEEDCKKIDVPATQVAACEGESCTTRDCENGGCDSNSNLPPKDSQEPCGTEGCIPQEIAPSDCTGDGPCRRKDAPIAEELPIKCEGSNCKESPETPNINKHQLSTDKPESKPSSEVAETVVPGKEETPSTPTGTPISEEEKIETSPISQSVTESEYVPTEHYYTTEVETKTDKVTEKTSELQDVTTENTAFTVAEGISIPTQTEQKDTEKPTEEEATVIPIVSEGDDEHRPTVDEKEEEIKTPDYFDREHTDKPSSVDNANAQLPDMDVKEHTDKVDFSEYESTKSPAMIDHEEPTYISGTAEDKYTEKPTLVEETTTKVSDIGAELTDKPDLTLQEVVTPFEEHSTKIPDTITEEPVLIDEDDLKMPDVVKDIDIPISGEEKATKTPDIDMEVHTDKPQLTEEEFTNIPDIMVAELTIKPALTEEVVTKKPDIDIIDDNYTGKPITADEESTNVADVEKITDKPVLVEHTSTTVIDLTEEDTKKPYSIEDVTTKFPGEIEKHTDEPTKVDEASTKIPDIIKEYTVKPAVEAGEDTKIPDMPDQYTDKPTSMIEQGTGIPDAIEEYSGTSDSLDKEVTKMPESGDDHSDEQDKKEGTESPDTTETHSYKPTPVDEQATKIEHEEQEPTDKPDLLNEKDVTTKAFDYPETDHSKKPMTSEEEIVASEGEKLPEKEISNKPDFITEEATREPTISDEGIGVDNTIRPMLIDHSPSIESEIDTSSKIPEVIESTGLPDDKEEKDKPSMVKEESKKPTDIVIDSTPAFIESEATDAPVTSETIEHVTSKEGGSGTEAPEINVTEYHEIPEIPTAESEPTETDLDKVTDKTIITDHTVTESNVEPIDVRIPEIGITTLPSESSSSDSSTGTPDYHDFTTEHLKEQEKSTKSPDSISEVTLPPLREGELETHQPSEHVTPYQEPLTNIYEVTKSPEPVGTTESVEQITKSTEYETTNEQEETYTDIPDQEDLVTKSPEKINIEPQDGEQSESPVSGSVDDESTTKLYVNDYIKPSTPESHAIDVTQGHEVTTASPAIEDVRTTETMKTQVDTETPKIELPDIYESDVAKMPTQAPVGVSEHDIKTGQPEIFTPEKEEMITSFITPTEPVKGFTEIEDSSITEQEETATGGYEESTEDLKLSVTEKIHEGSDISTSSSETPPIYETIATKGPEVSYTESQEVFTEAPVLKETTPASTYNLEISTTVSVEESAITESSTLSKETLEPVSGEKDHTTGTSESDKEITLEPIATELPVSVVSSPQEKPIVSDSDSIDEPQSSSTKATPEEIGSGEQAATETPEAHVTMTVDLEQLKTTESPDKHQITESQETDIRITQAPVLEYTEKEESDMKQQSLEGQQASTKYPSTYEEIRTELPHVKLTTEPSLSLITGFATEKHDTAPAIHETQTEPQTPEKPSFVSVEPEETTFKQSEETSGQTEFSETTPYLIELQEHTHKIDEFTSVAPTEEEEHTYKPMVDTSTEPQPEEGYTQKVIQDVTSELPSEEEHTFKTPSTESPPVEGYTYKIPDDTSAVSPSFGELTTAQPESGIQSSEPATEKTPENEIETATKLIETPKEPSDNTSTVSGPASYQTTSVPVTVSENTSEISASTEPTHEVTSQVSLVQDKYDADQKDVTTPKSTQELDTTPASVTETEKSPASELDTVIPTEKETLATPLHPDIHVTSHEPSVPEDEFIYTTTKSTTLKEEEVAPISDDKYNKPEEKPANEIIPSSTTTEAPKPAELLPTDEIPTPDEDGPSSTGTGYGETDYGEEDQAFGPGTCRYGGKVYVSAQQIPRDDPCDFCFCFRSDIICLQQSCPPPIHGCHEEPIQGFCCPRYECPVSMATTVNVTTTTTTTTTTLPPHFPTHSYKGAAQRRGCQIKGHTYKVGEVVRSSSGPCLHCTCGGDGQMKCDPKACTPEPMLRQMIAAAVSAKRRR